MKNIMTLMLATALTLGLSSLVVPVFSIVLSEVFMRMIRQVWKGCIIPKEGFALKWHWM